MAEVLLFKGGAGLAPALSELSRSKGLIGAPYAKRCTYKAAQTQGGAHKRRSMTTAAVTVFKEGAVAGLRVARSELQHGVGSCSTGKVVYTQAVANTRRCSQKGGMWPPRESY